MSERSWKNALTRTVGTLVLGAVPALALASFAPQAFSAIAAAAPQAPSPSVAAAPVEAAPLASTDLGAFAETASTASTIASLKSQNKAFFAAQKSVANKTSAALNAAVANALAMATANAANATLHSIYMSQFTFYAQESINFSAFYKKVSGKNTVGNVVLVLNSTTIVLQAQITLNSVSTQAAGTNTPGSVSSLTPPTF